MADEEDCGSDSSDDNYVPSGLFYPFTLAIGIGHVNIISA